MGYRPQRKQFALKFSGDFDGLEISVSSISFGELLAFGDQGDRVRAGEGLGAVRDLIETFSSKIANWNLEDDLGATVPITLDAVLAQEVDLVRAALLAWLDAMIGVSTELGKDSSSGPPPAPPNFPMEAL